MNSSVPQRFDSGRLEQGVRCPGELPLGETNHMSKNGPRASAFRDALARARRARTLFQFLATRLEARDSLAVRETCRILVRLDSRHL
jgi:hypothetical protein